LLGFVLSSDEAHESHRDREFVPTVSGEPELAASPPDEPARLEALEGGKDGTVAYLPSQRRRVRIAHN